MPPTDPCDPRVRAAFDAFAPPKRTRLLAMRDLILQTAAEIREVGPIEETLRWGEPSYLTTESKSGTMLRVGGKAPDQVAVFVHCQTDLIARLQARFGDRITTEGSRAVVFSVEEGPDEEVVRELAALALTYKLRRR